MWLLALHASAVLSSQSRPGRGTNGEGTCKWWVLAVDRNVDGGYATQVTIIGHIEKEEHSLKVNIPIVLRGGTKLITTI